jgi:TldD protein
VSEAATSAPALGAAHRWGELAGGLSAAADELDAAMDEATALGASFADARLSETEELRLYAVSGRPVDERVEGNSGIGVRALVDGAWGFAAIPLAGKDDGRRAARQAVANARAAAATGAVRPVTLPGCPAANGFHQTEVEVDPFAVAPSERERVVDEALAALRAQTGVVHAQAGVNAKRQHRYFANTEGSRNEQHFVETGGMVLCNAAGHGLVQRRSFPNSFHGNTGAAGWEYVRGLDLSGEAARVAAEAVALLTAPSVASGTSSVVIGPAQMALQVHESTGHPLELDRILGDEANYAGRSFIGSDAVGTLRYGSAAVNVTADPTVPGTRGSFAFDDEGTPAQRTPLISEGVIANFLSSRDSAARLGGRSTGAARSDGWGFLPLCFATHVFLEPGQGSTDELLERMGDGYYIDDNRSWSIDSRRLSFQFGTEVAWEVRGGKRTRLVRDFSYGGITPQFWGSVEAVAGPDEFRIFGMPCGKGEPKEWGFLSHGAAPTLVRDVRIGVA